MVFVIHIKPFWGRTKNEEKVQAFHSCNFNVFQYLWYCPSCYKNRKKDNADKELSIIERFEKDAKKKYPNLDIKQVTPEESTKIKEEMRAKAEKEVRKEVQPSAVSAFGSAPPVTALYINQIAWDEPNGHKYIYGDLTAPAVTGYTEIGVVEEGFGSDTQWLGNEQITYGNPDYSWNQYSIDYEGDRIVDGFFHVIGFNSDLKIQSKQTVQYRFESTSYNYPWNTAKTWINIPHQ